MSSETSQAEKNSSESDELLVVGLGASAGGLEALTELLNASHPCGSIAFVIGQHMSPQHRSVMVELLSKGTEYRVVSAVDGDVIEPDTVYVNNPNENIRVVDGRLQIEEADDGNSAKPSINALFASIAAEYRERAVAVVLSGTGSDGTQGCLSVRQMGGVAIAQSPSSAKYDGMPNSVIRSRATDLILSPPDIAAYIPKLQKKMGLAHFESLEGDSSHTLSELIERILTVTGVDFRQYKPATLERQVHRRMAALQIDSFSEYHEYVAENVGELEVLKRSFLISVTSFFRDKESFDALSSCVDTAIQPSVDNKVLRVWVPACATGEEAYSLAIMLAEQLGSNMRGYEVRIFATDIDDKSLNIARQGEYPAAAFSDMDEQRIENFFEPRGGSYRVKKWIRDMCMFAQHDIVRDPPFLKMNLISCRNLMIYFSNQLQSQLINTFHYSLVAGGALFLGKSESIGSSGEKLFEVINKTHKIFRRKSGVLSYGRYGVAMPSLRAIEQGRVRAATPEMRMSEKVRKTLIDAYAPPTIQLNSAFEPVEYFGDVSPYLNFSPGKASFDISSLANTQLKTELRALINRIIHSDKEVLEHLVRFKFPNDERASSVNITIRKLLDAVTEARTYLITFQQRVVKTVVDTADLPEITQSDDGTIDELQQELAQTRDHLQAVIEELETSNEDLQALNEELQSSTEELQASNEELETTNEELQATNEELTTVNDELQAKSILLSDSNETLSNIQRSLDMGLIVVDEDLRVTRFTPPVVRLFGILADDIGHKLTKLPRHIDVDNLGGYISQVMQTGVSVRRELERGEEKYLMNIAPYRKDRGAISGAVLTFTETTELSESQSRVSEVERLLKIVAGAVSEGVMVSGHGFKEVTYVSPRLEEILMRTAEVVTRDPETFLDVILHEDRDRVALQYRDKRHNGWSIQYRLKRRDGSVVTVSDTSQMVELGDDSGKKERISLLSIVDEGTGADG